MNKLKCLSIVALLLLAGCGAGEKSNTADPLSGKWQGNWGPSPTRQTEVVLELKWDGKQLSGTINPGSRAIEITKGSYDSATSAVTMELDSKSAGGDTDHYAIQGKVDGKKMSGTWTRNNGGGDFHITKD